MEPAHQYLLEAIKSYATRRPPYAALITGACGSGKTYFWRTVVTPALLALPARAAAPAKKGKEDPEAARKVIYVSLFGITCRRRWAARLSLCPNSRGYSDANRRSA